MTPRILMIVGMLIGAAGFVLGAGFDSRESGQAAFLVGFLVAALGIVWGMLVGGDGSNPPRWATLLIVVGFVSLVLAGLVSFANGPQQVSTVATTVGFAAMFLGIGFAILRLLRR